MVYLLIGIIFSTAILLYSIFIGYDDEIEALIFITFMCISPLAWPLTVAFLFIYIITVVKDYIISFIDWCLDMFIKFANLFVKKD